MTAKAFKYTKADGTESNRLVYTLHPPNPNLFGIDLSEFNKEEQLYYIAQLNNLYDSVSEEIVNMGLSSCYRSFKPENMSK